MFDGVFIGTEADKQPKKILILGESHYGGTESTEAAVKRYLENYNTCTGNERFRCYRFFDNIVRAFGIDPEINRTDFWNQVYFANFIDELCGVGDSAAVEFLEKAEKRGRCNYKVFSFLKEHEIDIVFCFSRRVYNKLPPVEGSDCETPGDKKDKHRLDVCAYYPGKRKYMTVSLDKPVMVYGLHHPSRGFSYEKYQEKLRDII